MIKRLFFVLLFWICATATHAGVTNPPLANQVSIDSSFAISTNAVAVGQSVTTALGNLQGQVNSITTGAIKGDFKFSYQGADNNGWILLNGRAVSALTSTQQAVCATLGIAGNIPNAYDKVFEMASAGSVGGTGGSNSVTIAQANIPNYQLTFGTRGNDGGYAAGMPNAFYTGMTGNGGMASTSDRGATGSSSSTLIQSGGSGTALTTTPAYIKVNAFIYLGS